MRVLLGRFNFIIYLKTFYIFSFKDIVLSDSVNKPLLLTFLLTHNIQVYLIEVYILILICDFLLETTNKINEFQYI